MQGHTFKYNNFKKLKQNVLLSTGEKNSKHLSPNLAVFNYSFKPKNYDKMILLFKLNESFKNPLDQLENADANKGLFLL